MAHPVVMISAYPMPTPIDLSLLPARLKDENAAGLIAQGLALIESIQSAVEDGEPYVQLRREEPYRSADRTAHGVPSSFDAYDAWVDEHRLRDARGWTLHIESLVTADEAADGVPFAVRYSQTAGDAQPIAYPAGWYLPDIPEPA